MYKIWAQGNTRDELLERLRGLPADFVASSCLANESYRLLIESFNRVVPQSEKLALIESLSFLPFRGSVNLDKPDRIFGTHTWNFDFISCE